MCIYEFMSAVCVLFWVWLYYVHVCVCVNVCNLVCLFELVCIIMYMCVCVFVFEWLLEFVGVGITCMCVMYFYLSVCLFVCMSDFYPYVLHRYVIFKIYLAHKEFTTNKTWLKNTNQKLKNCSYSDILHKNWVTRSCLYILRIYGRKIG